MLSQWESGEQWRVEVSPYALSLDQHVKWVADPGAGAISTFSGVTRDSFKGKTVLKLEYECYIPMALKTLKVSMGKAPGWPTIAAYSSGTQTVDRSTLAGYMCRVPATV